MRKVRDFKDLIVWQRAMDLSAASHQIARLLPRAEQRELGSQLRRSAVSITANIVEGHARPTRRGFLYSLGVARSELKELESHLLTVERVGYYKGPKLDQALSLADECSRMLTVMRRKLAE